MWTSFFLEGNPPTVTHQEKKVRVVNGRPRFYEPEALKSARATFAAQLRHHCPAAPLQGPVRLYVRWQFPRGRHKDGAWKTTRPDTDNLQKLLKDCMTDAGFWKDDAQVVEEECRKIWSDAPGIYVSAEELEPMSNFRAELMIPPDVINRK